MSGLLLINRIMLHFMTTFSTSNFNYWPWLSNSWSSRKKITISSTNIPSNLVDFPVYLALSELGWDFFTKVQSGWWDIRITKEDKVTEVAIDVVSCDTTNSKWEVHFLGELLSSSSDTIFYIYFWNLFAFFGYLH